MQKGRLGGPSFLRENAAHLPLIGQPKLLRPSSAAATPMMVPRSPLAIVVDSMACPKRATKKTARLVESGQYRRPVFSLRGTRSRSKPSEHSPNLLKRSHPATLAALGWASVLVLVLGLESAWASR